MNQALSYFRATWSELQLVRWPTRSQTLNLTVVVLIISLLVGAYVGSLDLTFTKTLSLIIK
ncbi:preprotein translocase subunit SecE [Candidatus Amesbacteria bacterium]|nr:preprotein translocase subunit SecE [Candidatus Amesbacteria bacterium]